MEDLRIVKTKRNLYESLMKLLEEKPFEEIKVSDICSIALVNRSTFYAHFSDKYELLSQLLIEYKESFIKELSKSKEEHSSPKQYYLLVIKTIFKHIQEQKDFYRKVILNNRNSIILDMFYDTLNDDISAYLKNSPISKKSNIPDNIIAKFYSGGVINVCLELLKSDNTYTEKQLIEFLNKLIPDEQYF